jgi:hypothetical protein
MLKIRLFFIGAFSAAVFAQQPSRLFVEDFASDPISRGWQVFGDVELLRWDPAEQKISVTWDSSRSNTFLRLPLGAVMTRRDDFEVSLDLLLNDFAAGVNPNKPGTFQLAFGFQNYADASKTNFFRAAANAAPNLVEFNFMPDTGFGPTIWPAVMSTNGAMNYGGATDFNIFNLPTDQVMRVSLIYRASDETITTTITANGELVGPVTTAHLATNDVAFGKKFTNFKVDTFAIASYSDAGQTGPFAGSLLAHGTIDNVVITAPPPPILHIAGAFQNGAWEVGFLSRTNWIYQLQTSDDFRSWQNVGDVRFGNAGQLTIVDTNMTRSSAFYRVSAQPAE